MTGRGGAIYFHYDLGKDVISNGTLTVKNSYFRGNGANIGGAIYNTRKVLDYNPFYDLFNNVVNYIHYFLNN
jgi:hypothetical protein